MGMGKENLPKKVKLKILALAFGTFLLAGQLATQSCNRKKEWEAYQELKMQMEGQQKEGGAANEPR